ncbi:MAG: SseB family protein [Litoreibacter sp.]
MTQIDDAHALMEQSDEARLRYFETVASSELFLLLEGEAEGESINPQLFNVEGAQVALAFDTPERLAEFTGQVSPYAAMSGRVLVSLLEGEELSLGLNLEVASSATLLGPDAIKWLHETLGHAPVEVEARPEEFMPPGDISETLITSLDAKLASAANLAKLAYLAGVRYDNGVQSHLLAVINPVAGAEDALAKAINEALVFSGVEAGAIDVAFFDAADPMAAKLARVGLRFDLPEHEAPHAPSTPGSNPDKPPILR